MGKVLFEQVCRQLNLLEEDYFGLEYRETGSTTYVCLNYLLFTLDFRNYIHENG